MFSRRAYVPTNLEWSLTLLYFKSGDKIHNFVLCVKWPLSLTLSHMCSLNRELCPLKSTDSNPTQSRIHTHTHTHTPQTVTWVPVILINHSNIDNSREWNIQWHSQDKLFTLNVNSDYENGNSIPLGEGIRGISYPLQESLIIHTTLCNGDLTSATWAWSSAELEIIIRPTICSSLVKTM